MSDELACTNSIFEQPWWLDAVAPGEWREATVQSGQTVTARLPYVVRRRRGLTVLTTPPYTQTLGPWLRPSSAKYATRLSEQHELLAELIDQLPPADLVRLSLAPSLQNWLPFKWKGYQQSTLYSYRIDDLSDLKAVWQDLRENIRREVRKAEKALAVRDDLGLQPFFRLQRLTYERQALRAPTDEAVVERLFQACQARGRCRLTYAVDSQDRPHAAALVVWDERCAYYIMGAGDPELRTSGAASLLLWDAIRHTATVARAFDFEGSMIQSIERFFRGFGARQQPYLRVMKLSRRAQALRACLELASAMLGRPVGPRLS